MQDNENANRGGCLCCKHQESRPTARHLETRLKFELIRDQAETEFVLDCLFFQLCIVSVRIEI